MIAKLLRISIRLSSLLTSMILLPYGFIAVYVGFRSAYRLNLSTVDLVLPFLYIIVGIFLITFTLVWERHPKK